MAPSAPDAPQLSPLIDYTELSKHITPESLWVLIDDTVYDITAILTSHPGGKGPLLKWAGKDATNAFKPIHAPGTLNTLPHNAVLGKIDPTSIPQIERVLSEEEQRIQKARAALQPPTAVLNLREVEALAETVLSATAWGYYRSAGDDERTFDENRASYSHWWFRPRVLRKISQTDTSCTIFGLPSTLPIWIAPAALARLGHPDGEMNLVRAAGKEGILQGISSNASCSTAEVMSARQPGQQLLFQLYVNKNRAVTEELVKGLRKAGYSGLILTVDAAVAGNRERDQRAKGDFTGPSHGTVGTGAGAGVAHAISGYQDPDVAWEDISWLQRLTDLPLYVKGIQCIEDAVMALEVHRVQGIILSNHGGRSLDYAPPPMTVLHELRHDRPDLVKDREVYLDGGVTRGTDVLKALCLGAKGVGLGRAFLYGNALWGEDGCRRVIQIMRDEIVTGMRLMGVRTIEELRPEMVRYVGEWRAKM
ncbi:FMN-dependent dehydrogenase-domain-containing protein [Vararia minispora EC-137]|uniref:FMN-dependent dehydrogenase-domain-containing protein n=1 Tax=Vararia minispora EC-137 TaxID=1314806 RepID=A0ACB8QW34_9AGAM|nr:FMN-dependent dehydrogenase-domain-containing protein [Vararia minispora EC-137]